MGPVAVALCLLLAALWGANPVAARFSLDTLPPIALAGMRFAMAGLFMGWWCRWQRTPRRIGSGEWTPVLITGSLLFLQIATFNLGMQRTSASHGTLLINTMVFFVAGLEHFVTRTFRLNWWKTAGLALAGSGAVLVLAFAGNPAGAAAESARDEPTLAGDLLLVLSAFLLGVKIIYTKQAVRDVAPEKLIYWHDWVGVALFAVFSLLLEEVRTEDFTVPAVVALVYQGFLVGGFCFGMQAWLLKRHPASQVSVFTFTAPLFGLALAVLLRGDVLSPWLAVSGLCVAAGILMVNTDSSRFRFFARFHHGDTEVRRDWD